MPIPRNGSPVGVRSATVLALICLVMAVASSSGGIEAQQVQTPTPPFGVPDTQLPGGTLPTPTFSSIQKPPWQLPTLAPTETIAIDPEVPEGPALAPTVTPTMVPSPTQDDGGAPTITVGVLLCPPWLDFGEAEEQDACTGNAGKMNITLDIGEAKDGAVSQTLVTPGTPVLNVVTFRDFQPDYWTWIKPSAFPEDWTWQATCSSNDPGYFVPRTFAEPDAIRFNTDVQGADGTSVALDYLCMISFVPPATTFSLSLSVFTCTSPPDLSRVFEQSYIVPICGYYGQSIPFSIYPAQGLPVEVTTPEGWYYLNTVAVPDLPRGKIMVSMVLPGGYGEPQIICHAKMPDGPPRDVVNLIHGTDPNVFSFESPWLYRDVACRVFNITSDPFAAPSRLKVRSLACPVNQDPTVSLADLAGACVTPIQGLSFNVTGGYIETDLGDQVSNADGWVTYSEVSSGTYRVVQRSNGNQLVIASCVATAYYQNETVDFVGKTVLPATSAGDFLLTLLVPSKSAVDCTWYVIDA